MKHIHHAASHEARISFSKARNAVIAYPAANIFYENASAVKNHSVEKPVNKVAYRSSKNKTHWDKQIVARAFFYPFFEIIYHS